MGESPVSYIGFNLISFASSSSSSQYIILLCVSLSEH